MKADAPQPPSRAALRAELEAAYAAAPVIAAPGPRPDGEALRAAYLGVLKLCLCDLGGSSTMSVDRTPDGLVASRELVGGWVKTRALGMDWPRTGLTMVGLDRLHDLQSCVESVVRDGVEGDLIEAGTWRGGASIFMRATLDSLGAGDRTVWVADSFQGFPATTEEDELAVVDFLAVSLEEVRESFARFGVEDGVRFLPGFFEETMSCIEDRRWSIIRLDGDSYEATRLTLEWLYPRLSVGGHLIVDDYEVLEECRQAVDEFRGEQGIDEPLQRVDWTCVRWRRERPSQSAPIPPPGFRSKGNGRTGPRAMKRPESPRIPTVEELELVRETVALRERLAIAEGGARSLPGSDLRRARAWLRRRFDPRRTSGPRR